MTTVGILDAVPAPLIIFAVLAVAAVVLIIPTPTQRRAQRARRPQGDQRQAEWAKAVTARLPEALKAQNVAKSGLLTQGERPLPRITRSEAIPHGWRWTLDLPGNTVADDWEANRIVAALNTGRQMAAVGEVHHYRDGWAHLELYRSEPLAAPVPVPWKPGELPSCCKPGTVCIGRRRDGQHIHFDLLVDGSGLATLIAGRRGSGKSETARLLTAQVAAWGWAPPIVVDLVRHGVDYQAMAPLLDRPIITDPKDAKALVDELNEEASERAAMLKASGQQKIGRFSHARPFRVLVWDEVQTVNDNKALKVALRRWVQQARPVGSAPVLITQYPTNDNIDSTLRAQIANVWSGRVRDHTQAGVIFGPLPDGEGPQHMRVGPGGCWVDIDEPDLLQGRSWLMSPQWLSAHVAALEKRSVRVG